VTSGISQLHRALFDSFVGMILLTLNGLINLQILLFFENKVNTGKRKLKKRHYSVSYLLSFLLYILVIFGSAAIMGTEVLFTTLVFMSVICILINTLILVLQNYIIIQDAKASSDLENVQLKAANADAANQLLRQQIHPHFLFNALNILKSLYKINPAAGEEYLVHLSDFLRAAVSTNNIRVIPLKDELKLCQDYLDMQKIRFGKALIYTISVPEECSGYVPSFSIHPLLENTIKHNELTAESPLNIHIIREGERIRVINNLKLKSISERSTGSGLANLSERYRMLSGDELMIDQTSETFSVSIKILSNEYCNN
jgi:sensor histidine kinase YesM